MAERIGEDGLTPSQRYQANGGRATYRERNRERLNAWRREYEKKRKAVDPEYLERRKRQVREQQKKKRQTHKAIIRVARDKPCVDCGVRLPPEVMDLDHVRGEKLFNICGRHDNKYFSDAEIRAEIAKCEVRCPNCHRLRHHYEREKGGQTAQDLRDP